jgi:O-acetyl-ADP-ribose deacetylase (regulator of RNase III)
MNYSEIKKDLFSVDESFFLAQCISCDAKLGKGIAVEFKKRFDLRETINAGRNGNLYIGTSVLEGRVFNLVTKRNYWDKPTYSSLASSLREMKRIALENGIKKIAMPLIGCGLDKLSWDKVQRIIFDIFGTIDIEILVCIYP